jgi:hypothetical protein
MKIPDKPGHFSLSLRAKRSNTIRCKNLTPVPSRTSSALRAPSPYLIRPSGTFSLKKGEGKRYSLLFGEGKRTFCLSERGDYTPKNYGTRLISLFVIHYSLFIIRYSFFTFSLVAETFISISAAGLRLSLTILFSSFIILHCCLRRQVKLFDIHYSLYYSIFTIH